MGARFGENADGVSGGSSADLPGEEFVVGGVVDEDDGVEAEADVVVGPFVEVGFAVFDYGAEGGGGGGVGGGGVEGGRDEVWELEGEEGAGGEVDGCGGEVLVDYPGGAFVAVSLRGRWLLQLLLWLFVLWLLL